MKTAVLEQNSILERDEAPSMVDTTFVMFFLAVELGRTVRSASFDWVLLALAFVGIMLLPFLMNAVDYRQRIGEWLIGRFSISAFAFLIGVVFNLTLQTFVPSVFKFLPMTFLIATAIVSCYIQFYGLLSGRQAN